MLGNIKFESTEVLISSDLIDSYISHDKSVSLNNVMRGYDNMKEEIENLNSSTVNERF